MGDWKAQVSVRIRQTLRAEIEGFAIKEGADDKQCVRTAPGGSNAQLKAAGSTDQLGENSARAEQSQHDRVIALRPKAKGKGERHVARKLQISLRIGSPLRSTREEIARRENRNLGNVATLLLECGHEQLKAGTTDTLRQCGSPFHDKEASKSITHRPKTPGVREDVWKGIKKLLLAETKISARWRNFFLNGAICSLA
jgi:hypothetical protein